MGCFCESHPHSDPILQHLKQQARPSALSAHLGSRHHSSLLDGASPRDQVTSNAGHC